MSVHEEMWADGSVIHITYDAEKPARERLATAAPLMARALLATMIRGGPDDAHAHTEQCWESREERTRQRLDGDCTTDCRKVRSVLTAAGVPLP